MSGTTWSVVPFFMEIKPIPKPKKRPKNPGLRKWLAFRAKFLKDKKNFQGYYICENCERGFTHIEVDHIVKRSIDPSRVYDESNLRLLCHECHEILNPDYNIKDSDYW